MGYGNKKKRSLKRNDGAPSFAPPANDGAGGVPLTAAAAAAAAAEGSHGSSPPPVSAQQQQHQVKPIYATLRRGEGRSIFQRPSSAQPCRFFQRGYCRDGEFCRFQHSAPGGAASAPEGSFNSSAKAKAKATAPSLMSSAPEECKDWYLTGSCPRYRTCRYAHPPNYHAENSCNNKKAFGMGAGGFQNMAAQLMGLDFGEGEDDWMVEQMYGGSHGFDDDDIEELALQGIKPWDPEAWDALSVLNGYY